MKLQLSKKEHWCDVCHRKIPKGVKYWREYIDKILFGHKVKFTDRKEHTNCEEFTKQPMHKGFEKM